MGRMSIVSAVAGSGSPSVSVPSWFNSGVWSELATPLSTSGVQQDFGGGQGVFTFSGGIVNSTGLYVDAVFIPGHFLIVWGGGGNVDYGGNELYAFGPLESNAPQWYRPRDRTEPFPTSVQEDGAGNPVSRHTYDSIVHVNDGVRNWLVSTGGLGRWNDELGSVLTNAYNFAQVSPNTNQPWSVLENAFLADGGPADVSAYDPITGLIWSHPADANRVQVYDVAGAAYTEAQQFKSPGWGTGGNAMSAIDTTRGIWCIVWNGGINFYRLNNGAGNDYYIPNMTGATPAGNKSVLWDPVDDRFVIWNGNGKQLHYLTPPVTNPYQGGDPWVWTSDTPAGGATPDAQDANGTKGRFGLIDANDFRAYILCNSHTSSLYLFGASA